MSILSNADKSLVEEMRPTKEEIKKYIQEHIMKQRAEFIDLFRQYNEGKFIITWAYTIRYSQVKDKFFWHRDSSGGEDGPRRIGECEISYKLAYGIYKEIR